MPLLTLGLNHTTAPVEIREQVAFPDAQLPTVLRDIVQQALADEVVIVSTCNRTELYCNVESANINAVLHWLSEYHAIPAEKLQRYVYTHAYADAVDHLLRVACGLDSMILGEPQILGQIKTAYLKAREAGTSGRLLSKLFEHSFSVAKQVRTDTEIGSSPVSVAFAAVRLAQQIFGDLSNSTALLIGAGETIELAARHLHEQGLTRMIVANRTLERARLLAHEFEGYAITLDEIAAHLAEADVVIASTASQTPILYKDTVQQAMKKRRHRPVFMVDIAVPRDIDNAVGEVDDVYLYTVDDLNEVIQENLRSRQQAAQQAEEIIETQVSHFLGWLKSLESVETICALRDTADENRQQLLLKAKRMVDNGKPPYEALEYLAHTLTNTLLHAPCRQLREAGYAGRDDLVEAAKELFQMSNQQDDKQ